MKHLALPHYYLTRANQNNGLLFCSTLADLRSTGGLLTTRHLAALRSTYKHLYEHLLQRLLVTLLSCMALSPIILNRVMTGPATSWNNRPRAPIMRKRGLGSRFARSPRLYRSKYSTYYGHYTNVFFRTNPAVKQLR
ncbi:hypothetical protein N656DRAFT_411422 [Canariomyces notabilis]|uniref:Uncharacterized protein n=1 Tax=Canariomyces notabilis TaxID=2074819 RepID=A0AAN6QE90_9PEZI|nr:hypothetical protein N656DRAFT_411422 [Canariomyces arenarius]